MCVAGGISAEMCVLYLFVCSKCRDRWGPRGVFLSCGFEPEFTHVLVGSVGKICVINHLQKNCLFFFFLQSWHANTFFFFFF